MIEFRKPVQRKDGTHAQALECIWLGNFKVNSICHFALLATIRHILPRAMLRCAARTRPHRNLIAAVLGPRTNLQRHRNKPSGPICRRRCAVYLRVDCILLRYGGQQHRSPIRYRSQPLAYVSPTQITFTATVAANAPTKTMAGACTASAIARSLSPLRPFKSRPAPFQSPNHHLGRTYRLFRGRNHLNYHQRK